MEPSEVPSPVSVLVVDDEELLARSCLQILQGDGYRVSVETRGRSALEAVRRDPPDIVLADLVLPDLGGLELLREIRRISPGTLVIVITGFATVSSSIEAMQAGAYDYIPKPFTATQLRILLGRASQRVMLIRDNARLRDTLRRKGPPEPVIGSSPEIRKVYSMIERIAGTDASVFISGESGTGKELVARALHARSPRADRPFVAINCAALPEHLLESELFGHERGAFTGANGQRRGLLETASGGTFFLDEISEMSLELQAKLLRVIQERKIRRVGGGAEIPIDVRWITATNRDPTAAVEEGMLRRDLFFRLSVVPIQVPPLRERKGDIPALAREFLNRFATLYQRPDVTLSAGVLKFLDQYSWPGNVRELQNLIERLVSLSTGGEITVEDLPEEYRRIGGVAPDLHASSRNGQRPLPFHEAKAEAIAEFERTYLDDLLKRHGGNISQAAREAGIDRKTIHRLIDKYDIENPFR